MLAAFKTWGLVAQGLTILGIIVTLSGILWKIHHTIWTDGYNTHVQEVKDAKAAADKLAAEKNVKTEKKYDKIKKGVASFDPKAPVSPAVGAAINSMP